MDTLQELEHLSLVSKIASEINNHVGVSDTTLAEFVIDQHLKSKSGVDEFKATLQEMGAEFPESLVQSIDRLMRALHPKYKQTSAQPERTEKKHHVLKGLSIPDTEPVQVVPDSPPQKEMDALDDTFAMLEGLAGQHKSSKRAPPDSPPRTKKRPHDYVFEDEFGRTERKSRRRRRSRSRSEDEDFRRPPTPEIDDEPILYKVYRGKVVNIKPFGVFVNLQGVRGKVDGLVHVSQMQEGARVNDPNDLVSRWQEVFVKVIKIEGQKLSLSMKSVDQESGHDLQPQQRIASGANMQGLGNDSAPIVEDLRGRQNGKQNRKRLTSPERWEIKQLIASGVIPKSDFPDIDEDYREAINGGGRFEEEEDEVEIEVREEEPPFLVGQTKQSLELSPIRVVKAPDGSMNRAAMTSASLAQERRELRQEEAKEKAAKEAAQVDLSSQWNDPMAQQKQFASDLRNNRNNQSTPAQAMPEWKKISTGRDVSFGKRTQLSMKEQRESLPVFRFRKQLLEAIAANSVLVIVGDTGSGKTTQFTQYLAEAGYANEGMIGCTQPRRVAAMSVAKRVAEEVGCKLGYEVGYTIRFEDCTNKAPPGSGSETRIKYMTDGILLREILLDPMLSRYSVIMLDEAHERSLNTDVLMGLMKKTLKRRPDLKFIVTSATLDADLFSSYYDGCPIFSIPGRTFPVEILYSREPESDYLDASLATVLQIHLSEDAGDILLFLTGKEEIDTSCEILSERMASLGPSVPELIILPIYGALPSEIASLVFDPAPPGARKVIIATNIAETSLTIDGIKFVIDPGFVKQSSYDPKLGMDRLQVVPISQAQARQRSGRAGRTGPGKCFRLYTEAAYQSELLPTNVPEIQRTNLVSAILQLKALGVNDLLGFDFISPPPPSTILAAMEELYALGCLDDEGLLTRLGRQSADFPMVPHLASALIKSSHLGCSEEVLTMVSCISGQNSNLFTRPKAKEKEADAKRAKFFDASGDFQTFVNVYQAWLRSGCDQRWCIENYIQPKTMMRIRDVRQQLVQIMQRHKQHIVSCGNDTVAPRKAICAGFFRNSARKDPSSNEYRRLVDDTPVHLHPSSALFGKGIQTLLFFNVVETSKEYMSVVAAIEPKWLVEAAPTFFKVAPTDRLSKRKKAERIQPLQSKWAGEDDWRLSAQRRQGRGGGGTWG